MFGLACLDFDSLDVLFALLWVCCLCWCAVRCGLLLMFGLLYLRVDVFVKMV